MSLRAMEIFCTVVETEKMAVAAEKLGMTPPAVSKAIKELENSLNTQLLIRTTRSMSLTVEGTTYYQSAKSILKDVHGLNKMFIKNSKTLKGKLKVVAPTTFGITNLGPVIAEFQRLFPDIILHIDFEDKVSALQEKGYDLAIRISESMKDSSLKARQFASFNHHLYVHKSLLKGHGRPKTVDDLKSFPCLTFAYHKTPNSWRMKKGRETISFDFKPQLASNSSLFLLEQVRAGMGVSLLPSFLNAEIEGDKELVELFPEYQKPVANGWVIFVRSGHMRLAERAFSDLLVKHFSI